MNEVFLKILNMSISASWIVLAVLLFRFILKKAPKWVYIVLWGIVALRLIFPFSMESALSLIPSAETIPSEVLSGPNFDIQTGITPVDDRVNHYLAGHYFEGVSVPADTGFHAVTLLATVWLAGIAVLLAYTVVSLLRLRRRVATAIPLLDGIYQSENVSSPFVLGIIRPKIYLPFGMDEEDLHHVIAHEQAHIRRKDHLWKPLGFLLLTLHWFNPLMWLAYVLLCRDIELACDEKVIKELDNEHRADYSQALLSCSVSRRMIAACPLAFGEVGVKERIKSVMNYKKPAFWIVLASVIACAVLAVTLLTNPTASREFSGFGGNVSDLEPQKIVGHIAEVDHLGDISLHTNADNFSIRLTSNFEMDDTQVIRFFYEKGQKTYSSQLAFDNDGTYRVTKPSEWPEQNRVYMLQSYLEALKYLPQEQIREFSPDADCYLLVLQDGGTPDDYDQAITYSPDGAGSIDGWLIHIEIQPLHAEDDTGYYGAGHEVIHVFYSDGEHDTAQAYVSYQCIYMNHLSSYLPINGDSGCSYLIGENRFEIHGRAEASFEQLEWSYTPFTQSDWESWFGSFDASMPDVSGYDKKIYFDLDSRWRVLNMDGELWIMERGQNDQMGDFVWSVYSLIPKTAMGTAQWTLTTLSSRSPVFQFRFDMEYTEISASCEAGQLVEFNFGNHESGSMLTFPAGEPLSWSPSDEENILADTAIIRFTIHNGEFTPYHGTIYIETSGDTDIGRTYTASLVGAGLHLSQYSEWDDGGIISLLD